MHRGPERVADREYVTPRCVLSIRAAILQIEYKLVGDRSHVSDKSGTAVSDPRDNRITMTEQEVSRLLRKRAQRNGIAAVELNSRRQGGKGRVICAQVLSFPHRNRRVSYLAIERLRQSDDTGTRIDNEMVRELYAVFHR